MIYETQTTNTGLHEINKVSTFPVGLSDNRGELRFTYYPALPRNSTRYPEDKQLSQDPTPRGHPRRLLLGDNNGFSVAAELADERTRQRPVCVEEPRSSRQTTLSSGAPGARVHRRRASTR